MQKIDAFDPPTIDTWLVEIHQKKIDIICTLRRRVACHQNTKRGDIAIGNRQFHPIGSTSRYMGGDGARLKVIQEDPNEPTASTQSIKKLIITAP